MKKGFTLIELLAVIVVLAIITVVAVPTITGVINKTKINALKQSAEGLIDASRLYNAQYANESTVRFDISNNVITSEDTDKMLKYKGSIKGGTVIIDTKGRSVICVTDGNRSAYKNYSENVVSISNNETCSIPSGSSIVYLGNEATITELSNQELTTRLLQLETELNELKSKPSDATPIGTIISYSTSTVPEGYLECNGQAVSRTTYADLFEKIGTTYGSGDGSTTFNVPDLRGEFLRGYGTNGHVDSTTNVRQGSGAQTVGTHQDATELPNISITVDGRTVAPRAPSRYNVDSVNVDAIIQTGTKYMGLSSSGSNVVESTASYTSRPTNTSVMYCIKY